MKISALKSIADVLSRHADIRAQDSDPRSKIGVQVDSAGNITLIASSADGGILYRVTGERNQTPGPIAYAIDSRPFIQAAKVLTGKGEASIVVTHDGLTITSSLGGSVEVKASCSIRDAGIVKKPKSDEGVTIQIPGSKWEQIARVISAIDPIAFEPPTIQVSEATARFIAVAKGNRPCYAMYEADCDPAVDAVFAPRISFWDSLKVLSTDGTIVSSASGFLAVADNIESWSLPFYHDQKPAAWPILSMSGEPRASALTQKTALIDAIRGVIPPSDKDEYARITMQISNSIVMVSGFGDEGGISVPSKTIGISMRSIRSDYLVKMLRALSGKEAILKVYESPPISISSQEMSGWTILVAPVALG
jgi:hypothetical protein